MKALGYLIGLLTHVVTVAVNYHAWVDHDILCQILLWVIVPITFIGLCLDNCGPNFAIKIKSPLFWCFLSLSLPTQMWIWFGGHSDAGFFYGLIAMTVNVVAFVHGTISILKENK